MARQFGGKIGREIIVEESFWWIMSILDLKEFIKLLYLSAVKDFVTMSRGISSLMMEEKKVWGLEEPKVIACARLS